MQRATFGPAISWWWPIWGTAIHGVTMLPANERVLRASVADAQIFWIKDRKIGLDARLPALASSSPQPSLAGSRQGSSGWRRAIAIARDLPGAVSHARSAGPPSVQRSTLLRHGGSSSPNCRGRGAAITPSIRANPRPWPTLSP